MEDNKNMKQKTTSINIPLAPHYHTLSNLNFKAPKRISKKQNILKRRNSSLKSIKTENNSFISPPDKKNISVEKHKRHKCFGITNYSNILNKTSNSKKKSPLNKRVNILNKTLNSKKKIKSEDYFMMKNIDEQIKKSINENMKQFMKDLNKNIKEGIENGVKEGIKEGLQICTVNIKELLGNGIREIKEAVNNGFSQFQENFFNYNSIQKNENGAKIADSNGKKRKKI